MKIFPVSYKSAARSPNIFFALHEKQRIQELELFLHLPKSAQNAALKLTENEFKAETGETKSVWFPKGVIKRIRLFGLGEKSKWNYRKEQLLPRLFVRYARGERIATFAAALHSTFDDIRNAAARFSANAIMANFEFNKYKERPKDGWPEIKTIYLAASKDALKDAKEGIREGQIIGEEVNSCRELANTPGGDMTPARLADEAEISAKKTGIKIKILGEKDIKQLGMGGVLGVARGSSEKPQFIILEYFHGPQEQKPLVLTGKGVTFDTGGLNLKPSDYIYEMHMDMSGGAAVIHGLAAVARLKLPVNVVGLIPAVENMVSGSSYRPGDILRSMSGKTIEVQNTDAEGRIILADGLHYAKRYDPKIVIDVATLTGAAVVALGQRCTALFTRDEKFERLFRSAGEQVGDYAWPLPLWEDSRFVRSAAKMTPRTCSAAPILRVSGARSPLNLGLPKLSSDAPNAKRSEKRYSVPKSRARWLPEPPPESKALDRSLSPPPKSTPPSSVSRRPRVPYMTPMARSPPTFVRRS